MSEHANRGRSSDDDATVALMAAGLGLVAGSLLGVAVASAAMNNNHARRQAFHKDLAVTLNQYGVDLISAALGRDRDARYIWHVTVQDANGVSSFPILFEPDIDPYSRSTLTHLAVSTLKLLVEGSVSNVT